MRSTDGGVAFTKGYVPDVVEAVFNAPVATIQEKNPEMISPLRRQADNATDGFFRYFLRLAGSKHSADTKDLSGMGKI